MANTLQALKLRFYSISTVELYCIRPHEQRKYRMTVQLYNSIKRHGSVSRQVYYTIV